MVHSSERYSLRIGSFRSEGLFVTEQKVAVTNGHRADEINSGMVGIAFAFQPAEEAVALYGCESLLFGI